jgi:hypothetical protein
MDFTPYDTPKLSELYGLFPGLTHLAVSAASWEWMHGEEILTSDHNDLSYFKPGLHLTLRACDKHALDPLYDESPENKRHDPLALPLASAITHLYLEAAGQSLMRDLKYFPALTHVALISTAKGILDENDLRAFLSSRPKLQRLVFVFRDTERCATFYTECLLALPVLRKEDNRIQWTHEEGTAYETWRNECTGTGTIWDN